MECETCETLFYVGLGEEKLCGKPAAMLLDDNIPVCADCAKRCHPSRLTPIADPSNGILYVSEDGYQWEQDYPPLCVVCEKIATLNWPIRGIQTCSGEECIIETARNEFYEIEAVAAWRKQSNG